jgi:tetratricopeptide (TPR) repeat protein
MLYVSLGAVLQRRDETARAERYYSDALALARNYLYEDAEVVPLAGLSDCCRHWGRFDDAISYLDQAVILARANPAPAATPDDRRRLAGLLLKLGQRYAEVGQLDLAEALLGDAGEHMSAIDSWLGRCQYLAAMAELRTWQHKIPRALELGQEALRLASELGRSPMIRQVHTTLAFCSVLRGDLDQAWADINAAERGEPLGRGLLTLALRGLIEYRLDRFEPAQQTFRQLRSEATDRSRRDPHDFGALDMEGFARCGEHLGRKAPPLNEALKAFHAARRITCAAGITSRLARLLTELNEQRLSGVIVAATGSGRPGG